MTVAHLHIMQQEFELYVFIISISLVRSIVSIHSVTTYKCETSMQKRPICFISLWH